MQYRRLGKTDLEVSVIGFGGIPIIQTPEEEAVAAVRRAIELGVNFIDTARGYKTSEEKIGKAIKGQRDQVYLASKSRGFTADEMEQEIDESLQALGVDYIDLYQIWDATSPGGVSGPRQGIDRFHIEPYFDPGMALDGLKRAREKGKVKFLGISLHGEPEAMIYAIRSHQFDTIQVAYNLTHRTGIKASERTQRHCGENYTRLRDEVIPLAQEQDMGIIIMKPLGGGILTAPSERLQFLLDDKVKTTAAGALRFVIANPDITCAIPGMANVQEVEEDVPVGDVIEELSPEETQTLLEEAAKLGEQFCRGCRYCLPCSEGINIPDIFRLMNYYRLYGLADWAKEQYVEMEIKADACVECAECEERCPYDLPIREMLKEAVEVFGK